MLFNSHAFLFVFLPLLLSAYAFFVRRGRRLPAQVLLIAASFVFYGWENPNNVFILAGSIVANYFIGRRILRDRSRLVFAAGVALNLAVLFYYKYINFFIDNLNTVFHSGVRDLDVALPLGISFYTFEQLFFLHDCSKGEIEDEDLTFADYALFLSYFPRLIAGPIVRFKEVVSQYGRVLTSPLDWEALSHGLLLFAIGLFKKEILADTLAIYANKGFDESIGLSFIEGWATSLCYTFQLYFDFSGYADMAIGISLMFGIRLPINFNSPYLSLDIQDFWRRWHMTLGRFIRDCLYFPLGGSRLGLARTCANLLVVFLLIGLWHGAGWLFVFWGLLHGLAAVVNRLWQQTGRELPDPVAWLLTFLFVNAAWVFFRAVTWFDAMKILKAMAGLTIFDGLTDFTGIEGQAWAVYGLLAVCFGVGLFRINSNEILNRFRPTPLWAAYATVLLFAAFFGLYDKQSFLYFNF